MIWYRDEDVVIRNLEEADAQIFTDELTAQFIRHYIANGTVGMLRAWISSDFPVSSRKIAEMMYDMSTNVQR